MRQLPGCGLTLLEVRVQLFQHHLQLVHLGLSDPGWLLAAKAGAGSGLRPQLEEPGLQALLSLRALGGVLSWLEYQGCLWVKAALCLGRAPHLVGLGAPGLK